MPDQNANAPRPQFPNGARSTGAAAGLRWPALRKRLMALDPTTVTTVLSLLPSILEQANKTIEKIKKGKRKDGGADAPGPDSRDAAARIADLEIAAMQQAEAVKLLAEQHAITIEALRREAARLERRLRLMTAVAMAGFALGLGGLVVALNLLLR
jgi:Pyruvate/2-oxoacid:ferredoxin oxidoreductase gamma subunit